MVPTSVFRETHVKSCRDVHSLSALQQAKGRQAEGAPTEATKESEQKSDAKPSKSESKVSKVSLAPTNPWAVMPKEAVPVMPKEAVPVMPKEAVPVREVTNCMP